MEIAHCTEIEGSIVANFSTEELRSAGIPSAIKSATFWFKGDGTYAGSYRAVKTKRDGRAGLLEPEAVAGLLDSALTEVKRFVDSQVQSEG